jgi:GNAT superfamily N-acetyltransferase
MNNFSIREVNENDKKWIKQFIEHEWASNRIITRGIVHYPERLPGLIAIKNKNPVGLLTYNIKDNECEIVSLNSLKEGLGIGSALIERLMKIANKQGCKRLWIITTNDNTEALRFYQIKGFKIKAIYIDEIKKSRLLKPEIPLRGLYDIEIRDEIELEKEIQ